MLRKQPNQQKERTRCFDFFKQPEVQMPLAGTITAIPAFLLMLSKDNTLGMIALPLMVVFLWSMAYMRLQLKDDQNDQPKPALG